MKKISTLIILLLIFVIIFFTTKNFINYQKNKIEEVDKVVTDLNVENSTLKSKLNANVECINNLKYQNQQLKKEIDNLKLEMAKDDEDNEIYKKLTSMIKLLHDKKYIDAKKYMTDVLGIEDDCGPVIESYFDFIFKDLDFVYIYQNCDKKNIFLAKDTQGNEFTAYYYPLEDKFYSILPQAHYAERLSKSFEKALKNNDKELLIKIMVEDDLYPTDNEAKYVFQQYTKIFDLETIRCDFDGLDNNGFRYKISGYKGQIPVDDTFHITYSDGFIFIKDYRGRYEWTGHCGTVEDY